MRCLFVLLAILPIPAIAQRAIPVAKASLYQHPHSKLALPATLGGLPRTGAQSADADQLDVLVNYTNADRSEILTVYITRRVAGSVPVWFDRAIWAIETRPGTGTPTRVPGDAGFVPPGQTVKAALAAVYALTGSTFTSTGVVLLPMGEWMVKLRYSSATMTPVQLDAAMKAVLDSLTWPATAPAAPAIAEVRPCTTPLAFSPTARPVVEDRPLMFARALVAATLAMRVAGTTPPEQTWCRDPDLPRDAGIYRVEGTSDSYLVALGDSGRAVRVEPDTRATRDIIKSDKPAWGVSLVLLDRTAIFRAFDGLPNPAIASDIAAKPYIAAAATWGDQRTVSINGDTIQ